MITERSDWRSAARLIARLGRGILVLSVISCGWVAVMAGMMWAGFSDRTALVVVANGYTFSAMAPDVRLVKTSPHVLTVYSEQPDFVRDLYASGAILVLPGRKSGCLSLAKPKEQS